MCVLRTAASGCRVHVNPVPMAHVSRRLENTLNTLESLARTKPSLLLCRCAPRDMPADSRKIRIPGRTSYRTITVRIEFGTPRGRRGGLRYPLSPVNATPAMMLRWNIMKMLSSGILARLAAVMIFSHSVVDSPRKKDNPTGNV